ncbi:hypothetical protein ACLMJK_004257 [Lecanora helva]
MTTLPLFLLLLLTSTTITAQPTNDFDGDSTQVQAPINVIDQALPSAECSVPRRPPPSPSFLTRIIPYLRHSQAAVNDFVEKTSIKIDEELAHSPCKEPPISNDPQRISKVSMEDGEQTVDTPRRSIAPVYGNVHAIAARAAAPAPASTSLAATSGADDDSNNGGTVLDQGSESGAAALITSGPIQRLAMLACIAATMLFYA